MTVTMSMYLLFLQKSDYKICILLSLSTFVLKHSNEVKALLQIAKQYIQ